MTAADAFFAIFNMSTPIPTAAALLHVELGAAQREFTELSPDECMAIAAHFRSLSNTLRSTHAELELCQRSHAEQLARADKMEEALEPFAEASRCIMSGANIENAIIWSHSSNEPEECVDISVADLRRARGAIAARKEGA
jgi:hypothetical protein